MSESEHVQRDIAAIRTEMEQIKSMQRLIVASNKEVKEHVRDFLSKRENAPEVVVLLAIGSLTQEEIAQQLGKSVATVSQVLTYLTGKGVIVEHKDPLNPRKIRCGLNVLENTVNAVEIAKSIISGRTKAENRHGRSRAPQISTS